MPIKTKKSINKKAKDFYLELIINKDYKLILIFNLLTTFNLVNNILNILFNII